MRAIRDSDSRPEIELVRSRDELVQRQQQYREMIENSVQGICVNAGARPLFVNQAYARILGYQSAQQVLELDTLDHVVAPSSLKLVRSMRKARMRGEDVPARYELDMLRKDGSTITVEAIHGVIDWEGQRAIQHTIFDISELKRSQQNLLESENRYRDLIENSVQGILIRTKDRRIMANAAYASIFGYDSAEEILALPFNYSLLAPGDRKRVHQYDAQRLRGEPAPTSFEVQGLRKDGELIWLHELDRLITWQGGPAIQITYRDITGRKRAQEELKESEQRYRALVEGSAMGICIRNSEHRLFVNAAFADIFGFDSVEEALKEDFPDIMVPNTDRKRMRSYYRDRLHGKNVPETYEAQHVRKDGTLFWALSVSQLVEWKGKPAIHISFTDITSQKQSEEELRQSEARYRDLIQGSVQGISIRGAKKRLLVNDSFAKMLGHGSPDELLAQSPYVPVYAPHERERLEGIHGELFRGDKKFAQYHVEGLRKDGSRIWLNAITRVIEWQGERAVQTTCTDITEQKISEEELKESERQFRDLIEGSAQGIAIRCKSKLVLVNDALARMFGYKSAQDVKRLKRIKNLAAPHEQSRILEYGRARLRGDPAPTIFEMEGLKADGSRIWVSVVARLIQWKGQPAIQTAFTDITERKRTQDELVAQRIESIGALAKGIAGEFNTIYNTIMGSISLAKMESYALGIDKISEILSDAEQNSSQARDLIQQLLVLSRGGSPAKERTRVEQIIKESLPFSGNGKVVPIRRDNIGFQLVFAGNLHPIAADRVQMKQVFSSIIENGMQSMPFGGTLAISAENVLIKPGSRGIHLEPGEYVKVTVKDQGQGMPQSSLEKLFDPYFRADANCPGLELSSAFSIVKAHEGTITVQSTLGKGTRLTVYIPAILQSENKRQ